MTMRRFGLRINSKGRNPGNDIDQRDSAGLPSRTRVVGTRALLDSGLPESSLVPGAEATDIWSRVARLLDCQKTEDEAIRAAFAIRGETSRVSVVQTRAFWRLLDESDSLAAEIASVPTRP
jgi:hypothetical protein